MAVIQPYILGSGAASKAIQKSLFLLDVLHPEWKIQKAILLKRDQNLESLHPGEEAVLFLANPHALHFPCLLQAQKAGFSWVVSEKPAAVTLEQAQQFSQIKIPVAVCHGYRQTWGIQTLKKMLLDGELGSWITIEGKYWQSSVAEKRMIQDHSLSWKDNPKLSGDYDVLLDLATHWTDLVLFLAGEMPESKMVWKSYANSGGVHRDTHNFISMNFKGNKRSFGSVSKIVHGCGNDLEIQVLGEKKSVFWAFMNPDQLVVGEGGKKYTLQRPSDSPYGSEQYPFHGTGWLEGYVEIFKQFFRQMQGEKFEPYPNLKDQQTVLELLLSKN